MFIKIVNKNNNATYEIQWGSLLSETFNEEIDTMDLNIKHLSNKIDIEPLDRVKVYSNDSGFGKQEIINNETYYYRSFLVDSFQCTQITAKETKYNYSISLFNEIKALEGISLPSLKITQLKENPRSVMDYLNQYLEEYGTKIRVKTGNTIKWQNKYSFSQEIINRFNNVTCPELQWNAPTLRQVFNDLMMIDDCIPTMQDNVINLLDLSLEKEPISSVGVNYVVNSQSSDDYVDELKIELKNVMQSNQNGVNNTNEICEYIGFRNDNVSVLNTQNILIQTTNPILEIEQVIMCCPLKYGGNESSEPLKYLYKELDITHMVYEQKAWQALPTLLKSESYWGTAKLNYNDLGKYQNTSLFFNRYGNYIDGFNSDILTRMFLSKQTKPLIQLLSYTLAELYKAEATQVFGYSASANPNETGWLLDDIKGITFKVKYKTTASSAMLVGREKQVSNKRAIVDNQTNSYVDAYAQGVLEYLKINRLSNELVTINARYNSINSVAQVGQKYQDNIIFKKEISINKDFVVVNYYATKDYVLKDYFTGVQAKIRSWKIVDGSEALERHDLIKYCLEFDYTAHNDVDVLDVGNYFLSPINKTSVKLMNKNVVQFVDAENNVYPSINEFYNLDFVTRISGNSILFTFGLSDNYSIAKYIDTTITDDVGGLPLQYYRYVDDNGENIGGNIYLNNEIIQDMPNDGTETTPNALYLIQASKPKISLNKLGSDRIGIPFDIHKDNSEITRITTQFEFWGADDIVVGPDFLKLQQCIRNDNLLAPAVTIKISSEKPNKKNIKAPSTYNTIDTIISVVGNHIALNLTDAEFEEYSGMYVYLLHDDKVLVAYKLKEKNARLYLNVLKERNKAVYDSNGNLIENI